MIWLFELVIFHCSLLDCHRVNPTKPHCYTTKSSVGFDNWIHDRPVGLIIPRGMVCLTAAAQNIHGLPPADDGGEPQLGEQNS
jgi:hypothetical protein